MPRKPKPDNQRLSERVELRLSRDQKDAFDTAASGDGFQTIAAWLRWLGHRRVNKASGQERS